MIMNGRLTEGLERLIRTTALRKNLGTVEEAQLLLTEMLFETDNPPYGTRALWEKAQKKALLMMPDEPKTPNRDFYTQMRDSTTGRRKRHKKPGNSQDRKSPEALPNSLTSQKEDEFFLFEARRYLRVRAAISTDDFETLTELLLPDEDNPIFTDGFTGVLERVCASCLTIVRHGRRHEQELAERGSRWLKLPNGSPWLPNHFVRAVRYYFADIGVTEPFVADRLWNILERKNDAHERGEYVVKLAQRFALRFTKDRQFRVGFASAEELLEEVSTAIEKRLVTAWSASFKH